MWIPITSFLILLFAPVSQAQADVNSITFGSCSYHSKTDLELTHAKWIWTDGTGKIVSMTVCPRNGQGTYTPCQEHGTRTGNGLLHPYLFLSVRQITQRLVNDVEYAYNDAVMQMSKLKDPREMYSDSNRFNDNGLLNIYSFKIGGINYEACRSDNQALGIAEHGLYIVNPKEQTNFKFHKIYYEPLKIGEYIVDGYDQSGK